MNTTLVVVLVVGLIFSLTLLFAWLKLMLRRSRRIEATGKEALEIQIEIFKTASQALGGAVLLLSLLFTWQTLQQDQEGQITERFTRAIDQLGDSEAAVKVGGVYALGRIANDSKKDHWPIMEILTAYARNNFSRATREEAAKLAPPEIQAVASVIGNREVQYDAEDHRIDLRNTNFSGISVIDANFQQANLHSVSFVNAQLLRVDFSGAELAGGADLTNASLMDADLRHARFPAAVLSNTDLRKADFRDADLTGIRSLANADVRGANLSTTQGLLQGLIDQARGDERTRLPPDLSPTQMLANQRDYEQRRSQLSAHARSLDEQRANARSRPLPAEPRLPQSSSATQEPLAVKTPFSPSEEERAQPSAGKYPSEPTVNIESEPTLEETVAASRRAAANRAGLPGDVTLIDASYSSSIPALIDELAIKDRFARGYAAEALGRIGESAVDPLIEAIRSRSDISLAYAAAAFGEIGPPARKAVPLLRELQTHRHLRVQEEAQRALAEVQRPMKRPPAPPLR